MPEYTKRIEEGFKVNEFRNFRPKRGVKRMFLYESAPSSSLTYMIEVNEPIEFPTKIPVIGDSDERFNE